jgi:uncharacterized membrane protein YeaQ/YmgE (transglycosylase-associated protein family)
MSIIILLIFGAIVGWLASVVMGSNGRQGLIGDIVLGIVGSLVGGWVMSLFGAPGVGGFDLYSIVVGLIGAIILIYLGRLFMRSRA